MGGGWVKRRAAITIQEEWMLRVHPIARIWFLFIQRSRPTEHLTSAHFSTPPPSIFFFIFSEKPPPPRFHASCPHFLPHVFFRRPFVRYLPRDLWKVGCAVASSCRQYTVQMTACGEEEQRERGGECFNRDVKRWRCIISQTGEGGRAAQALERVIPVSNEWPGGPELFFLP